MTQFNEIKERLCLENKDIARMLGFKSVGGYDNSSAKERYKTFITEFYNLVVDNQPKPKRVRRKAVRLNKAKCRTKRQKKLLPSN